SVCSRMLCIAAFTVSCFFFFKDPAPTEISPLSLHDALPICEDPAGERRFGLDALVEVLIGGAAPGAVQHGGEGGEGQRQRIQSRSEEHTSELQSRFDLVCRLLLEKKKKKPPPRRNSAIWEQQQPLYRYGQSRRDRPPSDPHRCAA